jgi:hypothetical protein
LNLFILFANLALRNMLDADTRRFRNLGRVLPDLVAQRCRKLRIILNPAVAFAQDAKTFGETICSQFLSITRKAIGDRRTHWAVIPANPCLEKTLSSHMFDMGLRLRGDDAAA